MAPAAEAGRSFVVVVVVATAAEGGRLTLAPAADGGRLGVFSVGSVPVTSEAGGERMLLSSAGCAFSSVGADAAGTSSTGSVVVVDMLSWKRQL